MRRAVLLLAALGGMHAQGVGFPVKPRTCYEATFRARVVQGPTLEAAPQLADVVPICVSRATVLGVRFAAVQWGFRDAAGKAIPRPHEGASPQTLFSREWRTFRHRFWTPENAVRFEIFPMAGAKGNKVELAAAAVTEVPAPATLNFNGDFSAADDAAWGWQLVGTTLFQNIAPGRSVVSVHENTVHGDLFPVTPGARIRVEATCSDPSNPRAEHLSHANVRLSFYGTYAEAAERAQRGKMAEMPVSPKGRHAKAARTYLVPEGRHWARVSVWHGIAEKIEVTEVKE